MGNPVPGISITESVKVCTKCKQVKPFSHFYKDSSKRIGLSSRCKPCSNEDNKNSYERNKEKRLASCKTYRQNNPEKQREIARNYYRKYPERRKQASKRYTQKHPERRKDSILRCAYGISIEEYNKKLELQGFVCAICKQECPSGKKLSVDHNHITGQVRGLLCQTCNRRLEAVEDEKFVVAALTYLEEHSTWESQ